MPTPPIFRASWQRGGGSVLVRGWGTVGGGAGVFRGAVLPGPPATLSSATQCVLLPLPPLLLLWVRARALALGPFASLHVPCPLSRSLCVSPLSEWGSPSFDPPWVHVMVKCAKRPAPVLARSVGSYEAAGICPLPWAPAWESLPPPPLHPHKLSLQPGLAGHSPVEVPARRRAG